MTDSRPIRVLIADDHPVVRAGIKTMLEKEPGMRVVGEIEEGAVKLTVGDRGRGFTVPERLGALAEAGHFGLVGVHERMELVGGTLCLASGPGQGTTLTAWVPSRPPG